MWRRVLSFFTEAGHLNCENKGALKTAKIRISSEREKGGGGGGERGRGREGEG